MEGLCSFLCHPSNFDQSASGNTTAIINHTNVASTPLQSSITTQSISSTVTILTSREFLYHVPC